MLTTSGRLEAATSRLEDIATSVDGTEPAQNGASASAPGTSTAAVAAVPESAAPPAPTEPLPRSIEEFDELIEGDVAAFVTASSKIGGLVEEQV